MLTVRPQAHSHAAARLFNSVNSIACFYSVPSLSLQIAGAVEVVDEEEAEVSCNHLPCSSTATFAPPRCCPPLSFPTIYSTTCFTLHPTAD